MAVEPIKKCDAHNDTSGDVVELVDTLDLGSSASRHESSSLSVPTIASTLQYGEVI